jgi:hypothetical protein
MRCVLTAASLKAKVFWDVAHCSLVKKKNTDFSEDVAASIIALVSHFRNNGVLDFSVESVERCEAAQRFTK